MIQHHFKTIFFVFLTLLFSCSTQNLIHKKQTSASDLTTTKMLKKDKLIASLSKTWNFENLDEWQDATQLGDSKYHIENGNLHIFTNPNTWERVKIKSARNYTNGIYSWRIYVPAIGEGDMAGINAFLYNNETRELDFEIAYGNKAIRKELNATADELIVYSTSQGHPFHSFQSKIKREHWYTLSIELSLNPNKKYIAVWKIDNVILTSAQLTYGKETKFKIYCSVENLTFMGDHIPHKKNYALFDWVKFNKI